MQLPVSPSDTTFATFCQRQQLDYIAAERWRYHQALKRAPEHKRGHDVPRDAFLVWHALDLHPQTPGELQARLDQLDQMEQAVLHGPDYKPGGFVPATAALLYNRPDA